MMIPGDLAAPLVLTKLHPPAARLRLLSRVRLLDELSTGISTGFILVSAPAGYGKTTLLAEWARSLSETGAAVAWYAIEPGDDDPIVFGSYLIASFIQALGPIPELTQLSQRLLASVETNLLRIFPVLINVLYSYGRETVLILDDYHMLSVPEIHRAVAYLIEHLPSNLHIAVGSRATPPLPLARLRARRQLFEIRTTALRFTPVETAQFLKEVMLLDLPPAGAALLEERTEGWAAGLQLAALSLSTRPAPSAAAAQEDFLFTISGSHRYLVDYLMEEVINCQPEEVQSFLLFTSILERMSAPLCAAILNQPLPHCEAIILQLEKANLFIVALDDQGTWYRYHHLFRDLLRAWLNKTQPERIPLLHRAACAWLAANHFLREAAAHAFQSKNWEDAAAFVEEYSFTLIIHSDIATIYEWCSTFPEAEMQRHPMLCLLQGLALAYNFRRQNRARIEARLHMAELVITSLPDQQAARGLNGLAAVVRTFLSMAPDPPVSPSQQLAQAQAALESFPEDHPDRFSPQLTIGYMLMALHDARAATQALETARQIALREGLFFGVVETTFHLARLSFSQGRLNQSVEICQRGQADVSRMLAHPAQELSALGCLDAALGCVFLEQDRLEEAEQHLLRGLELMGWKMNPCYLMTAYAALFRLYEIQGHPAQALKYLDLLDEVWPDIEFCTQGLRVAHHIRLAPKDPPTLRAAAEWCQSYSPTLGEAVLAPGIGPIGAADACFLANLAWIRAQIALGRLQPARACIQQHLDLAVAHGLNTRVIELTLLQAEANLEEGEFSAARAALVQALSIAQGEGCIHIFNRGTALTGLLVETAQTGKFQAYIERILTAIQPKTETDLTTNPSGVTQSALQPIPEPLSQRELEVLGLIAAGASNRSIADQLVISVGTVKSHINHILGKLDAHSRSEAAARARKLGLIQVD
jgi:LuxR family transcriptional regulator, maltose regulon positive regulatory protein